MRSPLLVALLERPASIVDALFDARASALDLVAQAADVAVAPVVPAVVAAAAAKPDGEHGQEGKQRARYEHRPIMPAARGRRTSNSLGGRGGAPRRAMALRGSVGRRQAGARARRLIDAWLTMNALGWPTGRAALR